MINLTPKQLEVLNTKLRYKVLNFGRRSGKTTLMAVEALLTLQQIPGAKVTYYAQTFDDARTIAWDIFLEVFDNLVVSKNETRLEIEVKCKKGGTSTISLKGWESVYQKGKGRGTENDLLLCDEVAFCKEFMEYFDKVLRPTLLTTKGRAVFGSTPNGFNDFHKLTLKAQTTGSWCYFHATSYDNPHNDPLELEKIKREISEDRFAQEYLADFRKLEGLVFKEFIREIHLKEPEGTFEMQKLVGVDFGFTDPTAIYNLYKDKAGAYWVMNEFYKRGIVEAETVDNIKAREGITYPDSANPGIIEALRMAQVRIREVVKGKDSIRSGIDKIKELFLARKLFISPHCVNLITELEQYVWDTEKKDTPIDDWNHGIDAIRYPIMMTYFRQAYIEPPKTTKIDPFRDHYIPKEDEEDLDVPRWRM